MTAESKVCKSCGKTIERSRFIADLQWNIKEFCDPSCRQRHARIHGRKPVHRFLDPTPEEIYERARECQLRSRGSVVAEADLR